MNGRVVSAFVFSLIPIVGPFIGILSLLKNRIFFERGDTFWLICAVWFALLRQRDGISHMLFSFVSIALIWLIYKSFKAMPKQILSDNRSLSLALLMGLLCFTLTGILAFGFGLFSFPLLVWPSVYAHTCFLLSAILALFTRNKVIRLLGFVLSMSAIFVSGSQETLYAWLLVVIASIFFIDEAKRRNRLWESSLLMTVLLVAFGLSPFLGWNPVGFAVNLLPIEQQNNLVRGSELPHGHWWLKWGVDVQAESVILNEEQFTSFAVKKTEPENWRRLQQVIPLYRDQPYTISTWIQANSDTQTGLQGWGQATDSKDIFLVTGQLSNGTWSASTNQLGEVIDSGIAASDNNWVRVWISFIYRGEQAKLPLFVGMAPDLQESVDVVGRFAGFQLEPSATLGDYQPGPVNRGLDLQTARLPYWQIAWQGIREKPWFGHGDDSFKGFYEANWPTQERLGQIPSHVHNLFLDSLFERGIFGFLGLLFFLYVLGSEALRRGDFAFTTLLVAILIINCFDQTLFYSSTIYPLAAVAGWRFSMSKDKIVAQYQENRIGVQWVLALVDYIFVFVGYQIGIRLFDVNIEPFGLISYVILLWPLLMARDGLYPGYGLTFPQELKRQILVTLSSGFILFLSSVAVVDDQKIIYAVGFTIVFSLIMLPFGRFLAKILLHHYKLWGKKVVILGAGVVGQRIARALQRSPYDGLHPIALFDDNKVGQILEGIEVKGDLASAQVFAREEQIKHAIVAITQLNQEKLMSFISPEQKVFDQIQFVPDVEGLPVDSIRTSNLDSLFALELSYNLNSKINQIVKRTIDVLGSGLGGLLISPFLLIIHSLIYVSSPGPVFFRQIRPGKDGKLINTWKFRTMVVNAEEVLQDYLSKNPEAKAEWEQYYKLKDDPRITKIGSLLRRTSLDELPQLMNVFLGEMSLIGPRPLPVYHHEALSYNTRTIRESVRPGMTGLWQVTCRSDGDLTELEYYDTYYIRNWSIWLDIHILLKTVDVVLRGKGAY